MSLHAERRPVVFGGRRFVVSPPSVQSVVTFASVFAREIVALRSEFLKGDAVDAEIWTAAAREMLVERGEKCAEVMPLFCSLWQGAPGELAELVAASRGLRVAIAEAAISICSPENIVALLDWSSIDAAIKGEPEPERDDEDAPAATELMVVAVALAFHADPREVMAWPYELVSELHDRLIPAVRDPEQSGALVTVGSAKLASFGVH